MQFYRITAHYFSDSSWVLFSGVCLSVGVRLSVCLSGSHTFLVDTLYFASDTYIPWNAAILVL